jgi:hypothetical protein
VIPARDIANVLRVAKDAGTIRFLRSLESGLAQHGRLTDKQLSALTRTRRRLLG